MAAAVAPAPPVTQATVTSFGNHSSQQVFGYPVSVAASQPCSVPPNTDAPIYFPPEQQEPVYLGVHGGKHPVAISCGTCGYRGESCLKSKHSVGYNVFAVMTLGLGFLVPRFQKTHHHCPGCNKDLAVTKVI